MESEGGSLNYNEFLQKFYLSRIEGGLIGYKSQKNITEFFFRNALNEDHCDILPTSESTYEKWFKGNEAGITGRNPRSNIWEALNHYFDSKKLLNALLRELNESRLSYLMDNFDIALEIGEAPNKRRFANAIMAQFRALASGNGSADNIVNREYRKPLEPVTFSAYLRGAKDKYKWIKLPGEEESLLSEIYVCSNIGTSPALFPYRTRGNYIEDATLSKIRTFDRRGEIRYAILIGACGYGKTLMLQHLFIDAVNHHNETSLLPILGELRNFSAKYDDLLSFLVETVQEYDDSFTLQAAKDLLKNGQVQILLDGLDEMDPQETKEFQKKLSALCHHYPNNQIVISSRPCASINGIRQFHKLYIQPFNDSQTQKLIDNLLNGLGDKEVNKSLSLFLESNRGYIKKNGFVATNPMLITIIVRHYEELKDFAEDKTKFYDLMYRVLINQHDEEKEAFDRFFHSVSDRDEFTLVYREFCARSYMDSVFEFDHRSFEKYFRQLKCKTLLNNPNKFQLTAFQNDVCTNVCMMYEQMASIHYIDPGFQEYFFAEYYYHEDTESTKEMGHYLWKYKTDSFRNFNALYMFYKIAKEKVEICILLPYLDNIFKGKSEEEAFLRFLYYGYGDIACTLLDRLQIDKYHKSQLNTEHFDDMPTQNHPKNLVMELLIKILELPNTFIISSINESVQIDKTTTHFLTGYYDPLIEPNSQEKDTPDHLRVMKHEIVNMNDRDYFQNVKFTHLPITDDRGYVICFGYVKSINPLSLLDNQDQYKLFMVMFKHASEKVFNQVKEYYLQIVDKQKVNEYR